MYCKVFFVSIYLHIQSTKKQNITMKKVVTVSLGGMAFSLEEDAYNRLKEYLKGVENRFRYNADVSEIMKDIESRMAEHFSQNVHNEDMVVSIVEVERVIGIMGTPSDFDEEEVGSTSHGSQAGRKRKKLYRDSESRVLGGVCSGLGYYWNMDPVILRILFVIFSIVGAGGLLIYLVLWIITPEAVTVAQRLEMKGEEVTAENIGKSFGGK